MDIEQYRIEYQEVGIRRVHYSNVRSALTTFLMTVSLAAFSNGGANNFTPFVGHLMIVFAILSCFAFSYRTEKAAIYYQDLWNRLEDPDTLKGFTNFDKYRPDRSGIVKGIWMDEMNWALIFGAIIIVGGYWLTR